MYWILFIIILAATWFCHKWLKNQRRTGSLAGSTYVASRLLVFLIGFPLAMFFFFKALSGA